MRAMIKSAEACFEQMRRVRRALHQKPEMGGKEFHTSDLIERTLREMGLQTVRPLPTAVIGILGEGEKTVALRADIDALPIMEKTDLPYASEIPGVMHACGHDMHTSALLGAAQILRQHPPKGRVLFLFEPDEEGRGGAKAMNEFLKDERIDAVFGCHVDPTLPTGKIGTRYGAFYAASFPFSVTVFGKSAHAAEPKDGVDALGAAAEMMTALAQYPTDKGVLSVCTCTAGSAENVIADRAKFGGIIRTHGAAAGTQMCDFFRSTLEQIAAARGVKIEINLTHGYPGVVNDDACTAFVERTAAELWGAAKVTRLEKPTMKTEDFGFFIDKRPGCYYHIGVGPTAPLHSGDFCPDERALIPMAATEAAIADQFLKQQE